MTKDDLIVETAEVRAVPDLSEFEAAASSHFFDQDDRKASCVIACTPEVITQLLDDQVFVFGSNELGFHGGGAAAIALEKFGAVWGEGEGLFGQSYALPTMGNLVELAAAVGRFLYFAATHPQLTFLVTKVGTGIAGHPLAEVAQLFAHSAPNVVLPIEFHNALTEKREQ